MAKPLKFGTNNNPPPTKRTSLPKPTSSNGSSITHQNTPHACAACRFQRRKCAPNCPLAPYFPAQKHQQFISAYKLFGVNNITKTLTSVPPHLRDDAMTALIYTANARARDPVGGCSRMVFSLEAQIKFLKDQLDVVRGQIAAFQGVKSHDNKFRGFREFDEGKVFMQGLCPLMMPAVHFSDDEIFDNKLLKPVQGIKLEPAHTKLSDPIEVYDNEDIKPALCNKMEPA